MLTRTAVGTGRAWSQRSVRWLCRAVIAVAVWAVAVGFLASAEALPRAEWKSTAADSTLRVAVVTDGADGAGDAQAAPFIQMIQREVRAAYEGIADVTFLEPRHGGGTPGGVAEALRTAERQAGADVVLAVGPLSAEAAAEQSSFAKPLVAVDVASGLFATGRGASSEASSGAPGLRAQNVAIIQMPTHAAADLRALAQLTTGRHIAILVNASSALAYAEMHPSVMEAADALGLTLEAVPVSTSPAEALAQVSGEAEAVYIAPLYGLESATRTLRNRLIERGLPSFVASDPAVVEGGLLAGADHDLRQQAARRMAVRVRELTQTGVSTPLAMQDPDAEGERASQLVVNEAAAQALGIDLPWAVRLNARLVGEVEPGGAVLTLADAMQESVARNLSLQIDRYETDATAENVDLARSRLLPQIDVEGRGRLVSEEQAEASLGSQPEQLYTGSATFRQVLFSEPAFANLSVERRLQAAEAFELDVTRLDAAEGAATAYTRLLRARSQAAIQRENLELALANLDAARTRRDLGEAGPAEVSRLETTVSQARRRVAQAAGEVEASEIALNQVLDRPLDAPVRVVKTDPEDMLDQFPYANLLREPMGRQAFEAFWVQEAREQAPAIQAAIRLTSAQERRLRSAERSFFLPEVSLEGSYTQRIDEGGAGTGVGDVPQNLSGLITAPPDEQWNVGITVTFPLFRGAERVAQRQQAAEQLRAARTQRDLAAQRVEQSARTAFARLETAYVGAQSAQAAAEAAARSLDVVQASYRRGTASVLDLLDAQSTALVTQVEAADAAYDFNQQWIELQRAAGSFTVLRTPDEETRFEERFGSLLDASMPDALDDR